MKHLLKSMFIVGSILLLAVSIVYAAEENLKAKNGSQKEVKTAINITNHLNLQEQYANLPLYFIENKGQLYKEIEYYIAGRGRTIYFNKDKIIFIAPRLSAMNQGARQEGLIPGQKFQSLEGRAQRARIKAQEKGEIPQREGNYPKDSKKSMRLYKQNIERFLYTMHFDGANREVKLSGIDEQDHKVNYFKGKKSNWKSGLHTFRELRYDSIYKDINLRVYGKNQNIKYDFILNPGASIGKIRIKLDGGDGLDIDGEGNLQMRTPFGDIIQKAPHCYQEIDGKEVKVAGRFKLITQNSYGFEVDTYNSEYALIIDP